MLSPQMEIEGVSYKVTVATLEKSFFEKDILDAIDYDERRKKESAKVLLDEYIAKYEEKNGVPFSELFPKSYHDFILSK